MSKYTVQDWLVDGNTVYALNAEGSNRFVATVQGGWTTEGRNRTSDEELNDNARLMAVAPELLQLLQDVVATRGSHFINNEVSRMCEWDERVLDVIGKATGK